MTIGKYIINDMRKSSYQKLKEENRDLKRQLMILSAEEDSVEAMGIKMFWWSRVNFIKTVLTGRRRPDQTPQL